MSAETDYAAALDWLAAHAAENVTATELRAALEVPTGRNNPMLLTVISASNLPPYLLGPLETRKMILLGWWAIKREELGL